MWTNQSCFARKDVVFMVTRLGEACARSAGEKKINEKNKNKFKKTGHLLRGLWSIPGILISVCFIQVPSVSRHLTVITAVPFFPFRLQREEEEAYASRHQKTQPQPSITRFSKFEERKTKEKSSKVHTVTKFFTPSTKTPPKKGKYSPN